MVFVGVFAGVTMGGYAANLDTMYEAMYEDSETGTNLADLWVDNQSIIWTPEQVSGFCDYIEDSWPSTSSPLDSCEGRIITKGTLFHSNDSGDFIINSVWHGIPESADIDRPWFPEGQSEGRFAQSANEIVMDAHITEALSLEINQTVRIGAGNGSENFTIVGIAYHPMHVFLSPEGSIFPPKAGEFVVGYLSDEGMERLTGHTKGSSNTLMIDVEGDASFDLPDTIEYEGQEIDEIKGVVNASLTENEMDGRIRDRGQNDAVELMRLDLEGAKKMVTPITVMIGIIAGVTIIVSLQRLVQSQAREIAILRTLGVSRTSLMTGYLIAPLVIGAIGCGLGAILGPSGMNGMLDFYQDIVGIPIVERVVPTEVYTTQIGAIMFLVFLSGAIPAWKATRLNPLDILGGNSNIRVGSNFLQTLTGWMPTRLGLPIRSSLRKPGRLSLTFLAVGISLMLSGSIQMMTVGMQESIVGGLEDDQKWDVQVYVQPGAEAEVIQWANENNATYEEIIEIPIGILEGPTGMERSFTLVALKGYEEDISMRNVNIIAGNSPKENQGIIQVMMDEGSLEMNEWNVGETYPIKIGGLETQVEITGSIRGEITRVMFFLQKDLSEIVGLNATAVYLDLPDGTIVDESLGTISNGIVYREGLLDGIKSLLDQQTQVLSTVMALGVLFTLAVMFNTMVMNIAERDFELATLRVLGASTSSLGGMLLFESILIGFFGGIVGIAFAFGGAVGMATSFSTWQFYFPVVLVPSVAYQLMGIVLLIAIAMVPIGIFRIRRMDLVEKVKDFSQ
jgi:putative ABC transport system permease protein